MSSWHNILAFGTFVAIAWPNNAWVFFVSTWNFPISACIFICALHIHVASINRYHDTSIQSVQQSSIFHTIIIGLFTRVSAYSACRFAGLRSYVPIMYSSKLDWLVLSTFFCQSVTTSHGFPPRLVNHNSGWVRVGRLYIPWKLWEWLVPLDTNFLLGEQVDTSTTGLYCFKFCQSRTTIAKERRLQIPSNTYDNFYTYQFNIYRNYILNVWSTIIKRLSLSHSQFTQRQQCSRSQCYHSRVSYCRCFALKDCPRKQNFARRELQPIVSYMKETSCVRGVGNSKCVCRKRFAPAALCEARKQKWFTGYHYNDVRKMLIIMIVGANNVCRG